MKRFLFLVSAALITVAGCVTGDGSRVKTEAAVETVKPVLYNITRLKIKPYSVKINSGYTSRFYTEGFDSDGKKIHVPADWKLSEGDPSAGTLSSLQGKEVIFTAGVPGKITLEAEYNGQKAAAEIEVVKKQ